ncbi:DUF5776 domain-containing protein [Levilactobacillus parabrevis]|uniref:DUF5776 domain-containing protein n=3 Tax=Levilactobacillus parabrevis TaxID=357278 RepID=UPI0021A8187F|nr:DUF5776 domain-containing protein [Levilactobacillus parabrevis]MCT4487274.1 hypothetical protein [Levilactobacillus parabrevis]
MYKTMKRLTISGLTLLLLGGILSPSIALADTTVVGTQPIARVAAAEKTYQIGTVEMPYTLISGKDGAQKVYWYPEWGTSVTRAQAEQPGFIQEMIAKYPNDDKAAEFANSIPELASSQISLLPGESLYDYVIREAGGEEATGMTAADYIKSNAVTAYYFAWDFSTGAKVFLKQTTQAEVQADYEANLKPRLAEIPEGAGIMKQVEQTLATTPENFYQIMIGNCKMYLRTYHLGDLDQATAKLAATVDPDATERQLTALSTKPLTDYLQLQADGTYKYDGMLSTEFKSFSSWYEDVVTPDPGPDPLPVTSQPVTVRHVAEDGTQVAPSQTLTGRLGSAYQAEAAKVKGYTLTKTPANATGEFTSTAQTVTYVYRADLQTGGDGDTAVPEGTVIYATKNIGLYRQATFTKQARKQWYQRKSRLNRPMFVVTGYAESKNGVARYKVKDVNHHSKTAGKTGYVTTNGKYTTPVYYGAKHKQVTVINPRGINAYSKKNLTGKVAHYRQGQVLTVKRVVEHNLTTRFVLSNGRYVTANKTLVQAGKKTMPKRVQARQALNRYDNVNLTTHNHHYTKKSQAVFKVRGWDYSNANNFSKGDTLRYQVAGGYISGNPRLVKTIK